MKTATHFYRGALTALLAIALSGCFSSGSKSGGPEVSITCADVAAQGVTDSCRDLPAPEFATAYPLYAFNAANGGPDIIIVDAGAIQRGAEVAVFMEAHNAGGSTWNGHVSAIFDAGCNGAEEWDMIPIQARSIGPGQTLSLDAAGQCGDMPTGPRTLAASLHGPDPEEILQQVLVLFDLYDDEEESEND